jgi:hypothetical protein
VVAVRRTLVIRRIALDVDEQRRTTEVEARMRLGTAVCHAPQQLLVEVRKARHIVRKERYL